MKNGDWVSVIDEDLSGVITSIYGEMITIRDQHGFTHHYPKNSLVVKNSAIYEDLKIEKKTEHRKLISKKHHKNHLILDLHFEKLVPQPEHYDSFERLFLQKEKLLETIAFCRKHHLKKLEVIHGIGDGVLQQMVYEVLESQTHIDFYNREILHEQSGTVIIHFL